MQQHFTTLHAGIFMKRLILDFIKSAQALAERYALGNNPTVFSIAQRAFQDIIGIGDMFRLNNLQCSYMRLGRYRGEILRRNKRVC